MSELQIAVVSITPTRRRRYLWAAWWSAPPERASFRAPDAHAGGARTHDEALAAAGRAAGRTLVEIESFWALAWARVLLGEPPFPAPKRPTRADPSARATQSNSARPPPTRRGAVNDSIWSILGVAPGATTDEIKRAFHKQALATHPDHGGEPDAFRRVRRAYEAAIGRRDQSPRRPTKR